MKKETPTKRNQVRSSPPAMSPLPPEKLQEMADRFARRGWQGGNVLLVIFDVCDPQWLFEGIGTYTDTFRLTSKSYLIYTPRTPREVRDHLWQLTRSPDDALYVITFTEPAAWAQNEPLLQWLLKRRPSMPSTSDLPERPKEFDV